MNIDQRHKSTSTGEPAPAVLSRTRLSSAPRGRRLPKNAHPANNTGSRPRLAVLSGGAQSDVELMQRFRAGDWGGFETLYDRYFTTAYLICRQTLPCSETALDSANDTFLALLANFGHLDPHRLGDWLADTAHYLAERRAQQGFRPINRSRLHLVPCYPHHDRRGR